MSKEIVIPEWFVRGMKFKSKHILKGNNLCTLLSFNTTSNQAEVMIEGEGISSFVEDDWNLQHAIWGFDNGEYWLVTLKITQS